MGIPESTGMDGIGMGNPERREGREKKQERKDKKKKPQTLMSSIFSFIHHKSVGITCVPV